MIVAEDLKNRRSCSVSRKARYVPTSAPASREQILSAADLRNKRSLA